MLVEMKKDMLKNLHIQKSQYTMLFFEIVKTSDMYLFNTYVEPDLPRICKDQR